MLGAKEAPKSVKEPRTVGIEPLERLAKVFVLPTPKKAEGGRLPTPLDDWLNPVTLTKGEMEDKIFQGLGFAPKEPQSTECDSPMCSDCNPPECCQEAASDDLLAGIAMQLAFLDQGNLSRAHALEQFKRSQKAERECELYALRCEINEAIAAGVDINAILDVDDRDVVHVSINRVLKELGYAD